MRKKIHKTLIEAAIKSFWETKQKQLTASGDSSNRGAVVGGKQLDAFADLLKTVAIDLGVPESCIFTSQAYLPGYFRSSKDWDFLIIAPNKKLIAAVELNGRSPWLGRGLMDGFPRESVPWTVCSVGWLSNCRGEG